MNQVRQLKLYLWITIDIPEIDKYKMHLIYFHGWRTHDAITLTETMQELWCHSLVHIILSLPRIFLGITVGKEFRSVEPCHIKMIFPLQKRSIFQYLHVFSKNLGFAYMKDSRTLPHKNDLSIAKKIYISIFACIFEESWICLHERIDAFLFFGDQRQSNFN